MKGPLRIVWGIIGGPSWPEETTEEHLEDALRVASANGGTIFDADGYQLSREDIGAAEHPCCKLAEEIVGSLMVNGQGEMADRLVLKAGHPGPERDLGGWSRSAAIDAVERCLEGSGL